jgi:hypothetical protein
MKHERPTIVCLCGSTRFMQAFQVANLRETLAGRIVLTVGCDTKSDAMLALDSEVKAMLDELHKRKIDLADEILVLNVGGYVGSSTASEIAYARAHGKRVRWLESVYMDHEWVTISEALDMWRGAPGYDRLYYLVKASKIETRRAGKYLTFRLVDLQEVLARQSFFQELAKGMKGDWYTRQREREQW